MKSLPERRHNNGPMEICTECWETWPCQAAYNDLEFETEVLMQALELVTTGEDDRSADEAIRDAIALVEG